MNKEKFEHVRNELVKKMIRLRKSANNTISKLKINEEKFADPFDQAAVESSKDIEINYRDKELLLLLDIKETIMRIDRGLFGICDHCGKAISQKRLMAVPMSKHCVICQKEIETRHNKFKQKRRYAGGISYNNA